MRFGGALVALGVVIGSVVAAAPVMAHPDGEVAIQIGAERIPPGGPIPIIGLDFSPVDRLEIRLVIGSSSTRLGEVIAGTDGHFLATAILPLGTAPGPVSIDAISRSGIIQRASFTVDPAAPAPTPIGAIVSLADAGPSNAAPPVALLGAAVAGVVLVLLALWWMWSQRRRAATDGRPRRSR